MTLKSKNSVRFSALPDKYEISAVRTLATRYLHSLVHVMERLLAYSSRTRRMLRPHCMSRVVRVSPRSFKPLPAVVLEDGARAASFYLSLTDGMIVLFSRPFQYQSHGRSATAFHARHVREAVEYQSPCGHLWHKRHMYGLSVSLRIC